jgi:hypothetical protein
MATFPGAIPSYPDTSGHNQNDPGFLHDDQHDNVAQDLVAGLTKVGTGASVPTTTGHVLTVTGAGATAYQAPGAGTPGTSVAVLDYLSASTAGAASEYSRRDHKHRSDRPILPFAWTIDTVTATVDVPYPLPVLFAGDLYAFGIALRTAASGGLNTKADLRVNGSTRLSTQPEIPVGQNVNTIAAAFSSTALSAGQLITVHLTQGSSGGPLTLLLFMRLTVSA